MSMSFELQDELQDFQDLSTYSIPNEHDLSSEDPGELLQEAVGAVAASSDAITDPQTFDIFRSILKYADEVPGMYMNKLLDAVTSGFAAELDSTIRDVEHEEQEVFIAHKMPLEMYAFLINWFVIAADKVKASEDEPAPAPTRARRGRGGKAGTSRAVAAKKIAVETWSWADHVEGVLKLMSRALAKLKTHRIWLTTPEREALVTCLTRPAYHVAENDQHMKSQAIRANVYRVVCLAVKHHSHQMAAQVNIIQTLQYHEHLSEPWAECLQLLHSEYDYSQLGDEVLRDIASKNFNAQDTRGPRAYSKFLTRLAELAPRAVLKQISLLLNHLDSESYPMRMALVEVVGSLIREVAVAAAQEESTNAQAIDHDNEKRSQQIERLFDLLLSRTLDLSSYVRAKVLQTISKLCDIRQVKFPKQRLKATEAATDMLGDKAAIVRKNALALLTKLITTHPYAVMEGGELNGPEWQVTYKNATAELQRVEGKLGKAIEREEEEEEAGQTEADGEETDGEEDEAKRSDDDMEVDEDAQDGNTEADGSDEEARDPDDPDATPRKKHKKSKKLKKKPRKSELNMNAVVSENLAVAALESNEYMFMKRRKEYCTDALDFIHRLEGSVEEIENLLGSLSKAEVLEAMEFFRVAYAYRLEGAEIGIKRMVHLIWSKDNSSTSEDDKELKGIRARLLECYKSIYFEPPGDLGHKQQINWIAKNMIELTYDATLAELTSLEEMLKAFMEDNQISYEVISKLWQVYGSSRQLPRSQRRGAIIILGMLAVAKPNVVSERLSTLLQVGLGPVGRSDLMLARYTCVALQRLTGSAKKVKGSLHDKNIRLEMNHSIFKKLQKTIEYPCRSKDWFGMAEQAINTIYALGMHPDELCSAIIKNLTRRAFTKRPPKPERSSSEEEADEIAAVLDEDKAPQEEKGQGHDEDEDEDRMDEDEPPAFAAPAQSEEPASQWPGSSSPSRSQPPSDDMGDVFQLSQLLFVVGHVAIKHIVYLELVEREWKRQKDEREAAEKLAAGKGSTEKDSKDGEELDQVAGNAEDEIGERLAGVRETELLYGPESLLAVYGPLLVHVCGSPHKFKNRTLKSVATLSFSKFLCISSQFCDAHHHLLFKILETSRDPNLRGNIAIALGDVAVSFSTIIDENSNELYKGLSDDDLIVRKNTLMVLTHLILNGMIKVKGQLGEMAKCLEDTNVRVSDLAKLFFKELSTKENAIYNNLPDVISHLSTGEHAVEEEIFQNTMKYIFTFVEKEKQSESIVEKLCQRFRLSEDPRQWRDIAFCLSLLNFKSERSVRKLIEGLQYYRDKLHEEKVFERFQEILQKARSNKAANKPDNELNEFEAILEDHKRQGEEDNALERRVEGKKAAAKKKATRKSNRKKGGGTRATRSRAEPEEEADAEPEVADEDDLYE
ncbi:hypothetical protein CONPUDRAFT_138601 [Coniophora puteana RWD-64-598 SS2]|uniref:Condensin complex subunit 1 n=1 Tax=Coniophora puteana (strain RWD-64-598) TaxID=741705 RepID=A0A5M3MHW5_CONPW|nr:uncharacterized protein CONPUDRAFT_138601 [Coniophora puteana RWD-64-598 SS2]EIW78221.1 hypothetical protein CONPUDRAFT_138601 [Coniophora puteana RWD-64-598 SS2]